jgi:uncharacterized membrane protein
MPTLPRWLTEVGWRTVIGALLLGGILHILATLAVPFFTASGTAFARLRDSLPANRMVLMPPPAPGKQPLPFITPDALYAMCRFDVSIDSLAVTAAVAHPGWTLSMHTPAGDNFYVMPAQQLRRNDVSLLLVPAVTAFSEFASTPRRIGAMDSQIPSPTNEGLVIVRAPLKGLAWRAEAEALLRRASCNPVKRAQ